jgi:DNA-binding NarL/FixJ family response regulator
MDPKSESSTPIQRLVRVLIVDDMPQVRQELGLLLRLSGELEVAGEAANGREAVALAAALCPDVVLMDLEMPVLDGFQAARQIKAGQPACRVIAFSVYSYPLARQKASQAGMDDFIEKGAPLHVILQALKCG